MKKLHEYNGYTNKPTWLVSLWIDNEESSQRYAVELAENCLINNDYEDEENEEIKEQIRQISINNLGDILEEMHEDELHNLLAPASVYTDLMRFALAYVNWREVAEIYIDMAIEELEGL